MKNAFVTCAIILLSAPLGNALAATKPAPANGQRPEITAISHMCVYASDPAASEHFYTTILGAAKGSDPEDHDGTRYYFSPTQFVEVLPLPTQHGMSRIDHVAYLTDDVNRMRAYLAAHGGTGMGPVETGKDGSRWFYSRDPEGNKVQFIQPWAHAPALVRAQPISSRIIHAGFLVHSRAAEDGFYRELVGFRPYWFGGMHEGRLDWISQQVPNGSDWLEYMMVGGSSDVNADSITADQLGVLNHFSLGVPSMAAAVETLTKAGRLSPRHNGPQIGKDGKWQYNLYDPDGTRVELMEFQPVEKPCCSPFTAASPTH